MLTMVEYCEVHFALLFKITQFIEVTSPVDVRFNATFRDEPIPVVRLFRLYVSAVSISDDEYSFRVFGNHRHFFSFKGFLCATTLAEFILNFRFKNIERRAATPIYLTTFEGGFFNLGIEAEKTDIKSLCRQA